MWLRTMWMINVAGDRTSKQIIRKSINRTEEGCHIELERCEKVKRGSR